MIRQASGRRVGRGMYHHMNGQAAEATLQLQSVSEKGTERMTSGLRIAAQDDSKASLLRLEARQHAVCAAGSTSGTSVTMRSSGSRAGRGMPDSWGAEVEAAA